MSHLGRYAFHFIRIAACAVFLLISIFVSLRFEFFNTSPGSKFAGGIFLLSGYACFISIKGLLGNLKGKNQKDEGAEGK
jgi:hypothetical protein